MAKRTLLDPFTFSEWRREWKLLIGHLLGLFYIHPPFDKIIGKAGGHRGLNLLGEVRKDNWSVFEYFLFELFMFRGH